MPQLVLVIALLAAAQVAQAAFAPNHFLGTCLDDVWVASMKTANQERDSQGRLMHPFLQPALKYPRYQVCLALVCLVSSCSSFHR